MRVSGRYGWVGAKRRRSALAVCLALNVWGGCAEPGSRVLTLEESATLQLPDSLPIGGVRATPEGLAAWHSGVREVWVVDHTLVKARRVALPPDAGTIVAAGLTPSGLEVITTHPAVRLVQSELGGFSSTVLPYEHVVDAALTRDGDWGLLVEPLGCSSCSSSFAMVPSHVTPSGTLASQNTMTAATTVTALFGEQVDYDTAVLRASCSTAIMSRWYSRDREMAIRQSTSAFTF